MKKYLIAALLLVAGNAYAAEPYQIVASGTVALTTGTATSSTFDDGFSAIRLVCTADCFVALQGPGVTITAATTSVFLPADVPLTVKRRGSLVVFGHVPTSTGSLYVTTLSE
jgi:hypothetical protein